MKLFWLISATIILAGLTILYFDIHGSAFLFKRKKFYCVNDKQIAIQIFVFECNGTVENVVKTVMGTYEKDSEFNFIPRINLILDSTTEEERHICRILEKQYDTITCSYSRDMYMC